MSLTRSVLILLLATSPLLCAEPAVYSNGKMTIPEGAVITDFNNAYFTNITLSLDGDGRLSITGAKAHPLVTVESVEILVMESFPLQVSVAVSGTLSVPCVELLDPAVAYGDNVFRVVLAESRLGPAESCIAVIEPFETSIPLDVLGLPAGTYQVDVNGSSAEFTFDMDNAPLGLE